MKYGMARFVYGLWATISTLASVGVLLLPDNTGRHPTWDDVVSMPLKILVAAFPIGFAIFCWKRYWRWTKESLKE